MIKISILRVPVIGCVFTFFLNVSSLRAQSYGDKFPPYILSHTEQRVIHSNINDVTYKLYISYPVGYQANPEKKYSVIYLLDADYSFGIAKNVTDHLSERNHLEDVIVIGIAYAGKNKYRLNRTRDYTPTRTSERGYTKELQSYSGGAPKFLEFIRQELFPYISKNFRTNGKRVLTGHSYGGLFTTWVFLTKPSLFNGYIAISPSLWYDDHYLFELARTKDFSSIDKSIRIYFTVGDREINNQWNMPEDLKHFVGLLDSAKSEHLNIETKISENETHNSIFPGGFTSGIRFTLNGF